MREWALIAFGGSVMLGCIALAWYGGGPLAAAIVFLLFACAGE